MTTPPARSGHLVVGVDTHKHLHIAAAVDTIAGPTATLTVPNDSTGFAQLLNWAATRGELIAFGVEGTGSYGQSLAMFLQENGHRVVEVHRPARAVRRRKGKSDAVDAEAAARAVLAGLATAAPKSADGASESLRRLKAAYDTAVKSRSTAMVTLKNLLVQADDTLRTECTGLTGSQLVSKLARLRPGDSTDPAQAARRALRSLARRWNMLNDEAIDLSGHVEALVTSTAPQLLDAVGVGPDTAAEILIAVGDNPERIDSEAALAELAGVCPIPAGSGKTDGRYRLNRGGNRQLNAALYRAVIVRIRCHQRTRDYIARRTSEGKSKKEIICCLKRYLAREIYRLLKPMTQPISATS